MKRVVYHYVEMRTILVPDEVCTDSYDEMISDIQEKVHSLFTGKEDLDTYLDGRNLKVEKADTRDWEIVSVEPVEEETAIEKARQMKDEILNRGGTLVDKQTVFQIIALYEKAYEEDAGD